MYIPFLGRLRILEWPVLVLSLILVSIESVLSWVTFLLPDSVIHLFDVIVHRLYPVNTDHPLTEQVTRIANAAGFVELCDISGYKAEEHIVKTSDGYLLGVHRIGGGRGEDWRKKPTKSAKPVVYLHHGLLMNSEVWVCNINPSHCLPFVLADMGYDVFLGNNRGNKYSKKHISLHPSQQEFWNFSMDDFALYDIPDTIDYILDLTGQKSVAYVGFSQGSAQAFASLSINPQLNRKVRLFVALAPAMAPPGLNNHVVDTLVKATPQLLYLLFGKRAILKSTTFWQSIMYPPMFVRVIDSSLQFLFAWTGNNIDFAQKVASYAHLYSYSSVKSVVHWFQVMRSGKFNMFDDEVQPLFIQDQQFYKVAPFPTRQIMTPVVLIYGKSDSLVNIQRMLKELPPGTAYVGVRDYEHLDMLWGSNVDELIHPYVLAALRKTDYTKVDFQSPHNSPTEICNTEEQDDDALKKVK